MRTPFILHFSLISKISLKPAAKVSPTPKKTLGSMKNPTAKVIPSHTEDTGQEECPQSRVQNCSVSVPTIILQGPPPPEAFLPLPIPEWVYWEDEENEEEEDEEEEEKEDEADAPLLPVCLIYLIFDPLPTSSLSF